MSHYLFVTFFAGGNVPPELGLARRLVERGHRVTVLGDDCLADEAKATGAGFVGFEQAPNQASKEIEDYRVRDWEHSNPLAGLRLMATEVLCGAALEVAQDVLAVHRRDPVDAVVSCAFLLGPLAAAEVIGAPSVVLMPNLDLRSVPGRPPNGPGFKPLRGPLGWLRDRIVDRVGRRTFAAGLPTLNAARLALDLPPVAHPFDQYSRAHRVLLLTSQSFDFPHQPLERTIYTGPVLDDPSWAGDAVEILAELDTVERPIVLTTLGSTFQNQREIYARVLAGLGQADVHAVVTLGGIFDPADFTVPANVRLVSSAPHAPILARASVALVHCGHGSVLKALAAGVPLVCLPLGRDQMDNAARVAWHGAGVTLKAKAKPSEIAAALDKVLGTPTIGDSARRLAAAIQLEVARGLALEELEDAIAPS